MSFLDSRGGKRYRTLFTSSEGREYWVELVSLGGACEEPPLVVTELSDGALEGFAGERTYHDWAALAFEHGCVVADFVSVEPTN